MLPRVEGWELSRSGGNTLLLHITYEYDGPSLIHFYNAWRLQAELTHLKPMSQPKLQQILEKWQKLPVDARPADQHPVKRPPTFPKRRRAEAAQLAIRAHCPATRHPPQKKKNEVTFLALYAFSSALLGFCFDSRKKKWTCQILS